MPEARRPKRWLLVGVCLFAAAACAPIVRGQPARSVGSPAASPGPTEELRGRISTVETDGTLILVPPSGPPRGFNADPRTVKVVRDGKPATLADLRLGDEVTVRRSGNAVEIVAASAGGKAP